MYFLCFTIEKNKARSTKVVSPVEARTPGSRYSLDMGHQSRCPSTVQIQDAPVNSTQKSCTGAVRDPSMREKKTLSTQGSLRMELQNLSWEGRVVGI